VYKDMFQLLATNTSRIIS